MENMFDICGKRKMYFVNENKYRTFSYYILYSVFPFLHIVGKPCAKKVTR